MTFSNQFSDGFSKEQSSEPSSIGALTAQFYSTFGTRDVGTLAQEFNEVMGDWKIGDFPP